MTDTVIMIDGSMMAVTGPTVIKVATGEEVTPDEMGGAQLHSEQSGEAHYRVATYEAAARLARRYFSYMPESMWDFPPRTESHQKRGVPTNLRAIVTQARLNARLKKNASWDIRTSSRPPLTTTPGWNITSTSAPRQWWVLLVLPGSRWPLSPTSGRFWGLR